jgi:REP element-mobilizing transposase RayT
MPPLIEIRNRGHLPHWESDGATYFVTFRLAGSLPQKLLQELREEIRASDLQSIATRKIRAKAIEKMLDAGHGPKHLATPEIANLVATSLRAFDGIRYKLFAWCVMPNHVHVVFQPFGENDLAGILHSWKSFTAREAQRKFGLRGSFWQREYYDHLVRNERQFRRAVRYVVENPAMAGLRDWRWVELAPR